MRTTAIRAQLRLENGRFAAAVNESRQAAQRFTEDLKKMKAAGPGGAGGRGWGGWTGLSSKIQVVGGAMRGLVSGAGAIAEIALDAEQLVAKLASTADGTETLRSELAALRSVSERPGLGFEQVVNAAAILKSTGMSAAEAREEIKAWGNAVATAGGSAADFEAVMVNVGQLRSGSGDMGEIKEIASRFPAFRKIADSLEDLRTGPNANPAAFMDAVRERLNKIPPAANTARASISKLGAELSAMVADPEGVNIARATGQLAEMGSGAIKAMQGKGSWMDVGSSFVGIGDALTGKTTMVDQFQMSPEQLKKKKAAEEEVIRLRRKAEEDAAKQREAEAEALFLTEMNLEMQAAKIERARIDGNREALRIEEDKLEVMQRAAKTAKDLGITEAAATKLIERQIAARREDERKADKARGAKSIAEAEADLAERKLRQSGRTREADKMAADKKEKARVQQLMDQGSSEADAKRVAGSERTADEADAYMQRTGRRRIRGARSENRKTGIGSTEFTGLDRKKGDFAGLSALDDLNATDPDISTSKIAAYRREMGRNMPRKQAPAAAEKKDAGFGGMIKEALTSVGMSKFAEKFDQVIELLQKQVGKQPAK